MLLSRVLRRRLVRLFVGTVGTRVLRRVGVRAQSPQSEKCSEKSENNLICFFDRGFLARFCGMGCNEFHTCVALGLSSTMDQRSRGNKRAVS